MKALRAGKRFKANNSVTGQVRFRVRLLSSQINGIGLFAAEVISTRRKIGHMEGEIIPMRLARKLTRRKRIALVELDGGVSLDASKSNHPVNYINHSCEPNAFMRIASCHVEFYTLVKISRGEEITVDYGYSHHEGGLLCRCGTSKCRGRI